VLEEAGDGIGAWYWMMESSAAAVAGVEGVERIVEVWRALFKPVTALVLVEEAGMESGLDAWGSVWAIYRSLATVAGVERAGRIVDVRRALSKSMTAPALVEETGAVLGAGAWRSAWATLRSVAAVAGVEGVERTVDVRRALSKPMAALVLADETRAEPGLDAWRFVWTLRAGFMVACDSSAVFEAASSRRARLLGCSSAPFALSTASCFHLATFQSMGSGLPCGVVEVRFLRFCDTFGMTQRAKISRYETSVESLRASMRICQW
jgi:hypothetical protein